MVIKIFLAKYSIPNESKFLTAYDLHVYEPLWNTFDIISKILLVWIISSFIFGTLFVGFFYN